MDIRFNISDTNHFEIEKSVSEYKIFLAISLYSVLVFDSLKSAIKIFVLFFLFLSVSSKKNVPLQNIISMN